MLADTDRSVWIAVAAIAGAALGAKLGYWIEDPQNAFADFPDWRRLLEGKTIVGALLGGLVGVEIAKRAIGAHRIERRCVRVSADGRHRDRPHRLLSCRLADHTYGNPTTLPWGVDFGDGVPRHPTQLYEIAFLLALMALMYARREHSCATATVSDCS